MKNPYQATAEKNKQTDLLVLEYIPLVKKIAYKLSARIFGAVTIDELVQIGVIGLIEAAHRFDEKRDNQFRTYAEFRIRGSMLDDLRARDWIPRTIRQSAAKLEKVLTALRNDGYDSPSDELICERLEIKLDDYHAFMKKTKPILLYSFEDLGKGNSDESTNINFIETVSNPKDTTPEEFVFENFDKAELVDAIQTLNEKEQLVLALYYQEDLNLKEIAKTLEVTESRVSQIRTKAILNLRGLLNEKASETEKNKD